MLCARGMEGAIRANCIVDVWRYLAMGADVNSSVKIVHALHDPAVPGDLSSCSRDSVAQVSLLHLAIINCFKQCRTMIRSPQTANRVDIIVALLQYGANPDAVGTFFCYFRCKWMLRQSCSCVELAGLAKQHMEYVLGKDILDQVMGFMVAHRIRREVGINLFSDGQHDVVEFLEGFFRCARYVELVAERYGTWGHVRPSDLASAMHVDRLFGCVREERLLCRHCGAVVLCNYKREFVFCVRPRELRCVPMSITEMYFDNCGSDSSVGATALDCIVCCGRNDYDKQSRLLSAPNVLLIQVQRGNIMRAQQLVSTNQQQLLRYPVAVEEQLVIDGVDMDLLGAVYHNGNTIQLGQYSYLCRGPGGGFWYFDDDGSVQMRVDEVSYINPTEVLMVVYARREQVWA